MANTVLRGAPTKVTELPELDSPDWIVSGREADGRYGKTPFSTLADASEAAVEAAATATDAADRAETAAAALEGVAWRDPRTIITVAGQQTYMLAYDPGDDKLMVTLNGQVLEYGEDYTLAGDQITLLAPVVQGGARLVYAGGRDIPALTGNSPAYDTLADFMAANLPEPVNTALVAGRPVIADDGGPIQAANLRNWSPPDGRLDIKLAGTASELASDFAGRAEQMFIDCVNRGWLACIGHSDDPYEWQRISVDLPGDLRVDLSGSNLYPRQDFSDFVTDGVTNSFTLGSWFESLSDCSSVLITGDDTYVNANETPATEFEVISGNTIRRIAGPPAAGTLRIASRWHSMRFISDPASRHRMWLRGGKLDAGRRGHVPTKASGSGFGFSGMGGVYWDGAPLLLNSGGDFTGTLINQRTDSALVFANCWNKEIHGLQAIGWGDLAVYDTGDNDGASDANNGGGMRLIGGYTYRCSNVLKSVKQSDSLTILGAVAKQCRTGILNADTDGTLSGGRNYKIDMTFFDIARRALDLRDMSGGGQINVTVEDWGYLPDGSDWQNTEGDDDSAAIYLSVDSKIELNANISQRNRPKKTGRPAIWLGGTGGHGNTIRGNITKAAIGLLETGGTGDTEFGNEYYLTMDNVDTPITPAASSRSKYRIRNLTGSPISGMTLIDNLNPLPSLTAFTPLLYAGATPLVIASTDVANGAYVRNGNDVTVWVRLQVRIQNYVHTGQELRIGGFPVAAHDMNGVVMPAGSGQITYSSSTLTYPAGMTQIVAEIPRSTSYARLRGLGSGINAIDLLDTILPAGDATLRTVRFDLNATYRVAA